MREHCVNIIEDIVSSVYTCSLTRWLKVWFGERRNLILIDECTIRKFQGRI
jgi:hypothetical protein